MGNSQQMHFMRTELDTQVRHANIFALELPRIVKLPKGQLGSRAGKPRGEGEGVAGVVEGAVTAAVCMQIFTLTAFA